MSDPRSVQNYSGEIVLAGADAEAPPPPVPSAAFAYYESLGGTPSEPGASADLASLAALAAELGAGGL